MNESQIPPDRDCARFRPLLALAAHVDLLDAGHAAALSAHLAGCSACRAELATIERAEGALRQYAAAVMRGAPTKTKEEIMRQVQDNVRTQLQPDGAPRRTGFDPTKRRVRRTLRGLPAIAAVLVVVALAVALFGLPRIAPSLLPAGTGGLNLSASVMLRGVSMVSADEGWAVGTDYDAKQSAVLLHFRRGQWTRVAPPSGLDPKVDLTSISMLSADEGWAVGEAVLLHYHAGRWEVVSTTIKMNLVGIAMVSSAEGWAIGQSADSTGLHATGLLHYTSGEWQQVDDPAFAGLNLEHVDATAASGVWVIARGANGGADTILHLKGQRWLDEQLPVGNAALSTVAMVAPGEGWAVGGYCGCGTTPNTGGPGQGGQGGALILHYHDGIWTEVTRPDHPAGEYLFGAAMASIDEGWAVGGVSSPTLLHYAHGQWTAVSSAARHQLLAVSVTPSGEGWAVGGQGTIVRLSGGNAGLYSGG